MMLAAPHMPERFLPMAGFALQHTEVVLCPRSMIGRVIGKNGETIKALQARACLLGLAYISWEPCWLRGRDSALFSAHDFEQLCLWLKSRAARRRSRAP